MPHTSLGRRRASIVALLAVAMVVSGYDATATPAPDRSAAEPATTTLATAATGSTKDTRDTSGDALGRPCKAAPKARCGSVGRWLDPADHSQGRIRVHYEIYPRTDRSKPSLGTVMAVEGGPGYSSTGTRDWYHELYAPLLDRRQLLMVDLRGTGGSSAVLCEPLQSYPKQWVKAIGTCGRQLGPNSDVYGSAFAADDVVAVLDRLGIDQVDLYGDSYGTFFSQTFAVRHPERVRTVTLDGAYFVGGTNPWYPDTNRGLRHAFDVACERSPTCARRPGSGMKRITRLAELLREQPIVGRAPNADGEVARIKVDNEDLSLILTSAASSPTIYREVDAAARAALQRKPYTLPLMRLAREIIYTGDGGPYRAYSEGLAQAVTCNDYPMAYDMESPPKQRRVQFRERLDALPKDIFAPFTHKEWALGFYGYYRDCMRWPKPSTWVPAVPADATYPDMPVLVINGDLDMLTSIDGGKDTARAFPNSTYVETHNTTHVAALEDWNFCASVIARRFVRTMDAGDTSCRKDYRPVRLVDTFARTAAETGWGGDLKRAARVANASAADVLGRWYQMYGSRGVGLHGGTFSYRGGWFLDPKPVVRWKLDSIRWVRDVAATGTMRFNRKTGRIVADLDLTGRGTVPAHVRVEWNDKDKHAKASAVVRTSAGSRSFTFPSA